MGNHSKLGASVCERWLNCPGSIALANKAPPPVESAYALEGTTAHELFEIILKENLDWARPNSRMGHLYTKYGTTMVEYVGTCVDWVREHTPKGATVLIEEEISLDFIDPSMFGTIDVAIVEEFGTLTVFDFKYGAGKVVSVENNYQMLYYALGVAHKYDYNFSDVKLVIGQPRAYHEDGTIREWTTTIETLFDFKDQLFKGVKEVKKKNAPYSAGTWCQFCPAAVICPELTKLALEQANIDFADISEDETLILPDPKDLAPEKISKILGASKLIDSWIKSVENYAFDLMRRGGSVEGFKLVEKRAQRVWNDEALCIKQLSKYVKKDLLLETKLRSPAQLESVLATSEQVKTKVAAKKLLEQFVSKVSSGLTIAPYDDKRPAVNSIQNDFNDQTTKELSDE